MSATEYAGIITAVEATSSHVKVQLDTVPDKTLVWLMTNFIEKPRPEVGKRLVCMARPGPHDELHVQRLISVTDAPAKQAVSTEITVDPTTLPLPSDATLLEQLAERILQFKAECKETFTQGLLHFKWNVGREICQTRLTTDSSYRDLEAKTSISYEDLRCCVKFFEKYPKHDYDLKAWRKVIAELPAGKEPTPEAKPAFIVDEITHWTCPECGIKFQHFHNPNGKHGLREVDEK
jgi:hypothetical protein